MVIKLSKNKNASTIGAGIVGAAIGAAVGAGAVALSNPKNQKFIKNKFNELKKQGQKVYSELQGKTEEKVEAAKKAIKAKL